jgi:hypothetical protein
VAGPGSRLSDRRGRSARFGAPSTAAGPIANTLGGRNASRILRFCLSAVGSRKCMMTSVLLNIANPQYVSAFSVVEYIEHTRLLTGFSPPP